MNCVLEMFEEWWRSQGGESVRAREVDRWTLALMAFTAGLESAKGKPYTKDRIQEILRRIAATQL